MKKRISALLLSLIIAMNLLALPMTAATDEENYAGNQLRILGILKGYTDGTLKLDEPVKRAQVAAMAVRVLGYSDTTVILGTEKPFTDVKTTYWGYNVIQNAYKLNIMGGYPQGDFRPENNVSYAEVVKMMVCLVGKDANLVGKWPDNYLARAKEIGIIPANSTVAPTKQVTRGEIAVIIWNTLLVKK